MKNIRLFVLLLALIILVLVFIFFDKIPLLGSGDLGIYPLLSFILVMLILAARQNIPSLHDYYNYFSGFNYKNGAKLLFFRGYSAVGAPIASRGYGGYSRIKLSDGRKIKVWSRPLAGMSADTFLFKGAGNHGELRKDKLTLNDKEYAITYSTGETSINYNSSVYKIIDSSLSITKNGQEAAKYEKYSSGTYIEVEFSTSPNQDELLLISLLVMDTFLFYVQRIVMAF